MKSLAYRTDLIKNSSEGQVDVCKDYYVIKTPTRPYYYWGNYILIKNIKKNSDVQEWINIYKKEFSNTKDHFMTFGIDGKKVSNDVVNKFEKYGFTFNNEEVLTGSDLVKPEKPKIEITCKEITEEKDWDGWVDVHLDKDFQYSDDFGYRYHFEYLGSVKNLVAKKFMRRFGAYANNKLVGDLGIFHESGFGRFDTVATHQDYRNLKICSNLIYYAGNKILDEDPVCKLVIVADEDYFAKNIYKKLGFEHTEDQIGFQWYK